MLDLGVDDRVLEIGCATGTHTMRLAALCREAVGIDLAAAAIERAKSRAAAAHIFNVRFLRLDASDLVPFPNASFDKVVAIDFTEHINDEAMVLVLREVRRVLRREGRFVIFTPCASHYIERLKRRNLILKQLPGHIAVREPTAYRRLLLQNGFSINSLYFSPSTYPLFGYLDRWLADAPIVGPLFRFRICIVARPTAA
jgi:ubiquinone/menaquinone biosynthesis C-methylase UbiE